MRFKDPGQRRNYYRNRKQSKTSHANNPTFGMTRTNTDTGFTEQYVYPGVWKVISGGFAEWDSIANKPACFPPCPHTHVIPDITDFPIGAWVIPPGITDPQVVIALDNLHNLLQSNGIIT